MARASLSLKARAIGLLAQREHSRAELRRKLLRIEQQQRARRDALQAVASDSEPVSQANEGPLPSCLTPTGGGLGEARPWGRPEGVHEAQAGEAAVDALIDALAADGYLDEARFIESRVHVRASRFGVQRIQQELAQHGLRLDTEQQAALRATELERAREVWLKRFGAEPSRDIAEQARQTRFLLARGFAPDLVRRLLKA